MQSTRKIHFSYFIKSKSPYDNLSLGTCQRFLYRFFACNKFCHAQLGVWAIVASFAWGQHASSKPVGLELKFSIFPGRRACLPRYQKREKEQPENQDPFSKHRHVYFSRLLGRGFERGRAFWVLSSLQVNSENIQEMNIVSSIYSGDAQQILNELQQNPKPLRQPWQNRKLTTQVVRSGSKDALCPSNLSQDPDK